MTHPRDAKGRFVRRTAPAPLPPFEPLTVGFCALGMSTTSVSNSMFI
jgi:hypothetical protein